MNQIIFTVSIWIFLILTLSCRNTEMGQVQGRYSTNFSEFITDTILLQNMDYNVATHQVQGNLTDSLGNPLANATIKIDVNRTFQLSDLLLFLNYPQFTYSLMKYQYALSSEKMTTSTTTDSQGNYAMNLRMGNFISTVMDSSGKELGSFRMLVISTITKPEIFDVSESIIPQVTYVGVPTAIPQNTPTPSSPAITPPSNLSYPSSSLSLTVGTKMTNLTPTVTGTVTSYSVSPAFPSGITLNTSSGLISGTPTATSSSTSYTITATNSAGSTNFGITIVVNAALTPPSNLSYSSSSLSLTVGIAMTNLTPSVTGTVTSYSVSPALPSGIVLNSSTGVINGTPSASSGNTSYTITATNSAGSTNFGITIVVNVALSPPSNLSYSSSSLSLTVNTPMTNLTPSVTGTVTSYTASPALPTGILLDASSGLISGTPSATSPSTSYTITATNSAGSTNFGITIVINAALSPPSNLSYSSSSLSLTVGAAMTNLSPSVTGTVTSYSVSPDLPSGITLNTSSGLISGTPDATSPSTSYTITATNSAGSTDFEITIVVNAALSPPSNLSYSSSSLSLTVNTPMTNLTPSVTGTVTSYSVSPDLPAGIILNTSSGLISGTPTTAQSSTNYTITASNSAGSTSFGIAIVVNAALTPPSNLSYSSSSLSLTVGAAMTNLSPSVTGTVTSYSVSPALPSGITLNTSSGRISGTPTTTQSSTSYTVTATNSVGSTSFSLSISISNPPLFVSLPSGILKTRQTTTYVANDDGFYQIGLDRTFTPGGTTGLIFQRCSAGQSTDATCSGTASTYTWAQATSYCSGLTIDGRIWRLPSAYEVAKLLDYQLGPPTINRTNFPNTSPNNYWSSTVYAQNTSNAYFISFNDAKIDNIAKTNSFYVRCVTGDSPLAPQFTDNGNGTISDSTSGRVWQKCTRGQTAPTCSGSVTQTTWANSITYCEGLTLGGRSDWRLPNINELRSIVDYTQSVPPLLSQTFFPSTLNNSYWSSTTYVQYTSSSYFINFSNGFEDDLLKSSSRPVRCVAGP
jgi:hypothetical protein